MDRVSQLAMDDGSIFSRDLPFDRFGDQRKKEGKRWEGSALLCFALLWCGWWGGVG